MLIVKWKLRCSNYFIIHNCELEFNWFFEDDIYRVYNDMCMWVPCENSKV
jgi:hypothetical protein